LRLTNGPGRYPCPIWTALPPKFDGENGFVPTKNHIINYLDSLNCKDLAQFENIEKVPTQIMTNYREYNVKVQKNIFTKNEPLWT
jgi:hypothetical protein